MASNQARRIWLSIVALLVAVCIGLSILAFAGAVVIIRSGGFTSSEIPFVPQSLLIFNLFGF
jgi:multisubunit Na+/H+ antiporter MnhC subunit